MLGLKLILGDYQVEIWLNKTIFFVFFEHFIDQMKKNMMQQLLLCHEFDILYWIPYSNVQFNANVTAIKIRGRFANESHKDKLLVNHYINHNKKNRQMYTYTCFIIGRHMSWVHEFVTHE